METIASQIKQLKQSGIGYTAIAKKLSLPRSTVRYHANENTRSASKTRWIERCRKNPLEKKINAALYLKCKWFKQSDPVASKRRGKMNNGQFSTKHLIGRLKANPFCYLTGQKIDLSNSKEYSIDHIVPVCLGGSNEASNLGLTTKNANSAKSGLRLEDFISLCVRVLEHQGYKVARRAGNDPATCGFGDRCSAD